jgi:hypothetical protein
MGDWIPHKEADLVKLIAVWDAKLASTANRAAFAWETSDCVNTQVAMAKFTDALAKYTDDPTQTNRIDKDEAMAIAISAMRVFAGDRVRKNPRMSVSQKLEMGVGPEDDILTPGGEIKDNVDMSFRNDPHPDAHTQYTDYKKQGAETKAKFPYHVAAFQICIQGPGDPAPRVDSDELWGPVILNLSSPLKIQFNSIDAGKTCWYRACWQAENTKQGNWTMASAMIP